MWIPILRFLASLVLHNLKPCVWSGQERNTYTKFFSLQSSWSITLSKTGQVLKYTSNSQCFFSQCVDVLHSLFVLNCVHSLVSMFTDWLSCKKFFYVYFRLYILSDRPSCKIPFIRLKMIFVIDYANLKWLSQLFLLLINFTALLQKLSISSHKFSRATASQRITSCVYMQCTSYQEVNPFLEIT